MSDKVVKTPNKKGSTKSPGKKKTIENPENGKSFQIEQVQIKDLKAAKYNPRTISNFQKESLRNSMKEFGIIDPIIINQDNTVIGGHQRLEQSIMIGYKLTDTVPCVRLSLTPPQEKRLNLALNKIQGEWDMVKLEDILKDLIEVEQVDISDILGFSQGDINVVLGKAQFLDQEFGTEEPLKPIKKGHVCPKCGFEY